MKGFQIELFQFLLGDHIGRILAFVNGFRNVEDIFSEGAYLFKAHVAGLILDCCPKVPDIGFREEEGIDIGHIHGIRHVDGPRLRL